MLNMFAFVCFYFLTGHVFPEFKESDAMFAAERVRYFVFSYFTRVELRFIKWVIFLEAP